MRVSLLITPIEFHRSSSTINSYGDISKTIEFVTVAKVALDNHSSSRAFDGEKTTTIITYDMTMRTIHQDLTGCVGTDSMGVRYEVISRLPTTPPRSIYTKYEVVVL